MGGFKLTGLAAGTANGDAIRYEQLVSVQNSIANLEFQDSVKDRLATPPGSPTTGDRYLVTATATGAWVGQENKIAQWNGSAWVFTSPTTGMLLSVDDENDVLYYYTGSAWVAKYFEATTASLGVEKVGMDIRLDLLAAGGLSLTGNEVGIDFSTAFNDAKAVKASDMNGTGFAQYIGVNNASIPQSSSSTLQGVLNDLSTAIANDDSVSYTAAANLVKGDLVYVSAANSVTKLPISGGASSNRGIGLAHATISAAGTVRVLADDEVVTGVLSGATAGVAYYWDGSAITATAPTASGSMVWEIGVAKNATDLHVGIRQIKRNS